MKQDLLELGYHFNWAVLNSRDFLLPQRRHRAWGIASLISQQEADCQQVGKTYRDVLQELKSNVCFPMEEMFPPAAVEEPKEGRHQFLVTQSKSLFFHLQNIFVDCAGSRDRRVHTVGAVPCITPSHPVYWVEGCRYLKGKDFLNAQGLWPRAFSPKTYASLCENDAFAQNLAGNSFSSTVNQSVLIASLVACPEAWKTIAAFSGNGPGSQPSQPSQPASAGALANLRRVIGKRKAPEYDSFTPGAVVKVPKRKKKVKGKGGYKRKLSGMDSRKKSVGKRPVATIWDKERVSAPELLKADKAAMVLR